jgi:hypothetical protein
LIRHREPPLGGAAIQSGASDALALDCFAAKPRLAMTLDVFQEIANGWPGRNGFFYKNGDF